MRNILKKSLDPKDLSRLFQAGRLTKEAIYNSLDQQVIQEHFSITDIDIEDNAIIPIPGVTFVFDLEGSSANIRDRGEQDFIETYAQMFKDMTNIIYSNGGIVEKFPGDGISAHFLQKPADPNISVSRLRAARAANDIQNYMRELHYSGYRISMWTGATTVATTIGNADHHELISIGHGVNMAHKLEKEIKLRGFTIGMDKEISVQYRHIAQTIVIPNSLPSNLCSYEEKLWYGA